MWYLRTLYIYVFEIVFVNESTKHFLVIQFTEVEECWLLLWLLLTMKE